MPVFAIAVLGKRHADVAPVPVIVTLLADSIRMKGMSPPKAGSSGLRESNPMSTMLTLLRWPFVPRTN
jgi:hypothetical protein